MKNLKEEYFGEPRFDNHTLDDIGDVKMTGKSSPENWTFVRACTQTRSSPLRSCGIYRVLTTTSGRPLNESGSAEIIDEEEVLERMPSGPRSRYAVPSIRGEYLSVKEVMGREQSDGTVEPETTGRSSVIPVEYVIEPLSYDEVIAELIDEKLE